MSDKITVNEVLEALKDIHISLEQWEMYIKNGATTSEFSNERQTLRNNVNYFLDIVNKYALQCDFEYLEKLEQELL